MNFVLFFCCRPRDRQQFHRSSSPFSVQIRRGLEFILESKLTVVRSCVMESLPRSLKDPLLDEGAGAGVDHSPPPARKSKWLWLQQTWILTLYCFVSAIQALLWMTYSSVDPEIAYGYLGLGTNTTDNATREQLTTWIINEGPIGYIFTVFTVPVLLLHPQGLRYAMLLAGFMPLLAAVLRMIPAWVSPSEDGRTPYLWLVFVAQAINAMAAPYTQSLPTHVSQTWFGVNWRAFATSVGRVSNAGGRSIGYFIGPALAHSGKLDSLMYVELGTAAAIFVAVVAYFPATPRYPPTRSADALRASTLAKGPATKATNESQRQVERIEQDSNNGRRICRELGTVVCSKSRTILLLVGFGVQMGAYGAWSGVLLPVLTTSGMDSQEASDIGAYNTLAGVVGGVAIGLVVAMPQIATRLRVTLVLLSLAGAATFALVLLALPPLDVIHLSKTTIVLLCTLGGLFRGMLDPLFFELATEISYPSSPAVVGGVLTVWTHVVMVIVLSLPSGPVNEIAMYLMPVALVLTAIMVCLVKDKYHRRTFDTAGHATTNLEHPQLE